MIRILKRQVRKVLPLLITVFLFSCTSYPVFREDVLLAPPAKEPEWFPTEYSGLKILAGFDESLPVGGAALALQVGQFEVLLTPRDITGRGETRSSNTSDFTEETDIQIGVNGSPFSKMDPLNRTNRPMDIVGIQINHGVLVSPPVKSFDAMYILNDGSILFGSQAEIPDGTVFAVGGFRMLLNDGQVLGSQDTRHPRTAVGLSRDKKIFYIAVFDGRQADRAGLTTEETALWMNWLGCDTALNLDGGGSSSLVLKDSRGVLHILNSPVHRGRPGLERAVGNNIGFKFYTP